ncbi:MAG TPA: hypothetical protein VF530_03375 [Planctomycetota bacterium]
MKLLSALCLVVAAALPASAQESCSSLEVTSAVNPVRPFQTVTIDLEGSLPNSPVFLLVGETLGQTRIDLRALGVVMLDLEQPFQSFQIGLTDGTGGLTRTVTIPSDLGLALHAQAVGLKLRRNAGGKPMADICVSNVASFEL